MTADLSNRARAAVKTGKVTLDAALIGQDLADELAAILCTEEALILDNCEARDAQDGVTLFEGTPDNLRGVASGQKGPRLRVAIVSPGPGDTAPQVFVTLANGDGEVHSPQVIDSFEDNDLDFLFDMISTGPSFVYASTAVDTIPTSGIAPEGRAFARGLNVDATIQPGHGLVTSLVSALVDSDDEIGKAVADLLTEALKPLTKAECGPPLGKTNATIALSDKHIGTYLPNPNQQTESGAIEGEMIGSSDADGENVDTENDALLLDVPFVTIHLPFEGAKVSFGSTSLTLEACALAFPLIPGAETEAIIAVGFSTGDTRLEARVSLLTGQTLFRLENSPTAGEALGTLLDLDPQKADMDTSGLLTIEGLPQETLKSLGAVKADEAWVLIDPAGFTGADTSPISCAGLSLSMADPITLIENVCTFSPRASLRIDDPLLETRKVTGTLSGNLKVGTSLEIDAELLLPDGIFAAAAHLNLDEAVSSLGFKGAIPENLKGATCDLTLAGDWGARAFAVEFILTGGNDQNNWAESCGPMNIHLQQVAFGLNHIADHGGTDSETSFHFAASMQVQATTAKKPLIFGVRGGWDSGWYFEGGMDGSINLSDIVKTLFPGAPEPDNCNTLRLADLWISADLRNGGKYALQGRTEGDWKPIPDVDITVGIALLELQYESGQGDQAAKTSAHIIGSLGLGDLHISCNATKLASDDGWTISGGLSSDLDLAKLAADLDRVLDSDIAERVPDDLRITDLTLSFDTSTKTVDFSLKTETKINETNIQIDLEIHTEQGETVETKVEGTLRIGDVSIKGVFLSDEESRLFVGTLELDDTAGHMELGTAIGGLLGIPPPDVNFDLKKLLFLWRKAAVDTGEPSGTGETQSGSGVLFDLNLEAEIALDLSQALPIGAALGIPRLSVNDIALLYTSAPFTAEELKSVRDSTSNMFSEKMDKTGLTAGFQLSATLAAGDGDPVDFSVAPSARTTEPAHALNSTDKQAQNQALPSGPTDGLLKWFDLDKSLGPLHVARLGIGYDAGTLGLMLDSDIDLAGLSVGLSGFGLHFALDSVQMPSLSLDGLAIAYAGGPVTISGAFQKGDPVGSEQTGSSYDGTALIEAGNFSITGFGSYAAIGSQPSLFIYAALLAELGGPPCFRVKGLSAGFGYNRRLTLPKITEVQDFPFIKALAGPQEGSKKRNAGDLQTELKALAPYVTPALGEYWLAAGIKFNSFELVEAVALLSVSFGQDVEIGVLGLAQMRLPRGGSPGREIAFAELALRASIKPEDGTIFVEGRLTDASFILSRDCRLQGGFALMFWLAGPHEGDFVITLGGYHPTFKRPDHYPDVPRIGLHWEVTRELTITAEMYFALTPKCVMAGGRLSAIYTSQGIKAWFIVHADFLLNWEPLHYSAEMGVTIGFEVDLGLGTLRASRGVDLSLWGPEFGGKVTVDLTLITIEIAFGPQHTAPDALDAEDFETAFLPVDRSTVLAARIAVGLRGEETDAPAGAAPSRFVDLSNLQVVLQSSVPIEGYRMGTAEPVTPPDLDIIGIAPMASQTLGSQLEIEVVRRTGNALAEPVPTAHLRIEPQYGNVPAALWQPSDAIGILEKPPTPKGMTLSACTGVAISPAPSKRFGTLPQMPLKHFDTQPLPDKSIPDMPAVSANGVKTMRGDVDEIMSDEVVKRRAAVLRTLQEISPFKLGTPDLSDLANNSGDAFSAMPIAPAPLGLVGEA